MDVVVRREDITSPTAATLITALNAELSQQYPEPGATHFRLGPEEVAEGRGAFLVACVDGTPLGCGAVRSLGSLAHGTGELKRMYVAPSARGQGIGRVLLTALEQEARLLGVRRLVLETGVRQEAAIALYRKTGFAVIPAYGEYTGSPTSICMGKDL
jgi:GNAT superfamily N-acetyltransferase